MKSKIFCITQHYSFVLSSMQGIRFLYQHESLQLYKLKFDVKCRVVLRVE